MITYLTQKAMVLRLYISAWWPSVDKILQLILVSVKNRLDTGLVDHFKHNKLQKQVGNMVFTNRRLKVMPGKILHNDLNMKKVSSRCISRLLTPEKKRSRKEIAEENVTA